MAADRLVVSDLLCYLVYKFGKMPLKELKAVLLDFLLDSQLVTYGVTFRITFLIFYC